MHPRVHTGESDAAHFCLPACGAVLPTLLQFSGSVRLVSDMQCANVPNFGYPRCPLCQSKSALLTSVVDFDCLPVDNVIDGLFTIQKDLNAKLRVADASDFVLWLTHVMRTHFDRDEMHLIGSATLYRLVANDTAKKLQSSWSGILGSLLGALLETKSASDRAQMLAFLFEFLHLTKTFKPTHELCLVLHLLARTDKKNYAETILTLMPPVAVMPARYAHFLAHCASSSLNGLRVL
jgi:hypothetical protein